MSESRPPARTNGYLPVGPFRHMEPTAVGEVHIDHAPLRPVSPGGGWSGTEADTLLLVRLHGAPLGLVHIEAPPARISEEMLTRAIWEGLEHEIRDHVSTCGCAEAPDLATALTAGISASGTGCPAAAPVRPPGTVAVIIPTSGRSERLARCLASLAATCDAGLEIIVVDNAPDIPGTREVVDAATAQLTSLRYVAETRPGSSVARNRGIAETAAEIVAFTDDDVIVDAGWLRWLLAAFLEPEVKCVTGMVLPLELQTPAQKQFELYAGFSKGVSSHQWRLRDGKTSDRFLYPYWGGAFGSGNSMAFRREDLIGAGGFDPALGAGSVALAGADIEAMSAVILRGGTLVYEPRSICWHEHRRDETALARQVFNYGVGFTAIMTKFMVHDRHFLRAVVRALPKVLLPKAGKAPSASESSVPALPENLVRLQRRGMLRGPARYARSVRWARRLCLGRVIAGG